MSRQYLNNRWCVQCGRNSPTPYLAKNWRILTKDLNTKIVDVGCGNGRNSLFLKKMGFKNIVSIDMAGNFGEKAILGVDALPIKNHTIDLILANYILMFLSKKEQNQIISQFKRISKIGCKIIVEFYPAKDSEFPDNISCLKLQEEIFKSLNWKKIKYSKFRFIAEKLK